MFAATKVLQRYGLKYSYIYNCPTKSEEFLKGYETFIRTAAVLKSLRTLRIAKKMCIRDRSTSPLGNPKLAAVAILMVNIWQGCAIPTVLFIAGLQSVPKELLEAATIDGAGNWARFWNVIIPYLIPVLNMVIITQAKAGLTVFDYIKVMTNGGPAQSTEAVGLLIYRHATVSYTHLK